MTKSDQEKAQKERDIAAAIEATRKNLQHHGDKIPPTYYDYFMLALFVVIMLGGYSYWFFSLGMFWERPYLLFRRAVIRMRNDRELRRSLKIMMKELEESQKKADSNG